MLTDGSIPGWASRGSAPLYMCSNKDVTETGGMEDTLTTVSGIIRDMFDEYDGPIGRSLTADQVPQWDSLAHVQLIVAIERACRIRFNSGEIRNFENLGELIDAVDRKKIST